MKADRRDVLVGLGAACLSSPALAQSARPVDLRTLPYAMRDGKELLLDIYRPAGASGPLPVIVFLHGGGWRVGTRTTGPDFRRFFAQDGFAMVAIEYRLTPAIRFPANLEDVRTSIRFLRSRSAELGIDPNRIGLWGTSAGAHLAAMAALAPEGQFEGDGDARQSSRVSCALDAYGPMAFDVMDAQARAEAAGLQAPVAGFPAPAPSPSHDAADSAESLLLGAPIQSVRDRVRQASPLAYVTAQAPPFLIVHGTADNQVPHQQSVMLYEALKGAGTDVTLRLVDGLPHTFFNRSDLDDAAGPFRMDVWRHARGAGEVKSQERAGVFEVARAFFTQHLR